MTYGAFLLAVVSELTLARLFDHLRESRQITHRRKLTGGTYL